MRVAFLDMDGVIADFVGAICKAHGRPSPYTEASAMGVFEIERLWGMTAREFWQPCNDDAGFWYGLELMPDAEAIVTHVSRSFGPENVAILTSPSLDRDCVPGKRAWIKKYFPQFAGSMIFTGAKRFLAHEDAMLIDDRDKNVEDFIAAGGEAVLIPRPWNVLHSAPSLSALPFITG